MKSGQVIGVIKGQKERKKERKKESANLEFRSHLKKKSILKQKKQKRIFILSMKKIGFYGKTMNFKNLIKDRSRKKGNRNHDLNSNCR